MDSMPENLLFRSLSLLKLAEYGFTNSNFGHDEFDKSAQRLSEWTWAQTLNMYWRMPIAFDPKPGPRQLHYDAPRCGSSSNFTTPSTKPKTSRTLLQNLYQPGRRGFRLPKSRNGGFCILLTDDAEQGSISGETDADILAYRYIPKVGPEDEGIAADEHVTFDAFAVAKPKPKVQTIYHAARANFSIDTLDCDQLPTIHNVISRLAELPVHEVIGGKVVEGVGVPGVSTARPME